jgi:hypothetical protein
MVSGVDGRKCSGVHGRKCSGVDGRKCSGFGFSKVFIFLFLFIIVGAIVHGLGLFANLVVTLEIHHILAFKDHEVAVGRTILTFFSVVNAVHHTSCNAIIVVASLPAECFVLGTIF